MTSQLNNSIIADYIQCYSIQAVTGSIGPVIGAFAQAGAVTIPAIATGGIQTANVTFNIPFPSTPNVVQSLEIPSGSGNWTFAVSQAQLVTPTGFQVSVRNTSTTVDTTGAGQVAWIATL